MTTKRFVGCYFASPFRFLSIGKEDERTDQATCDRATSKQQHFRTCSCEMCPGSWIANPGFVSNIVFGKIGFRLCGVRKMEN